MTFVLYGQTYSLESLDFNLYIGGIFSGTMQVIGSCLGGPVIANFNRIPSIIFTISGISFFCIIQIFFIIPDSCQGEMCWQRYMTLFCYSLGCFLSNIFFVIISAYFPELYPTKIRGMGVGFIRGIGIAGSIISPFFIQLFDSIGIQPLIPIGIIGGLTLILVSGLTETKNKPLKEHIEEQEQEEVEQEQVNDLQKQYLLIGYESSYISQSDISI
ncbi:Major facilitator superfamily domain, general substrate transporter [Pseudocohnilembus persalinus]|uniref:Major facilitator superfamily domain, general substrate transporter n=1 Tax=Pseudocohnilembus persalinus TaxID=266149 RepID=A0A0V0QJC8_PSEPJ|nr:Major facilitator superfamily domain, general substrate transporter [Pseudocohnilembus persalinus]|eukprot:KRX02415.1 Major facilitator superfamily domain, general substrate transporter [Pseudocohnilembus persalinus]